MALKRFLVAPLSNTGLQDDLKPWLIPDEAFARLNNAYVFRGRVRKRFGAKPMNTSVPAEEQQFHSRLRTKINDTSGSGVTASGNAAGTAPGVIFQVGQAFSISDIMFTVTNPATGPQQMLRSDGSADTATFNISNGDYNIQNVAVPDGTQVYFYPATPVMGLPNYETPEVNNELTFAFDTQFAYQYTAGAWSRLGTAIWSGTDSDFFWATNYRGEDAEDTYLFVTNFVAADGIKYWDGAAWNNLVVNTGIRTISTARLIVSFQDRLLLMNIKSPAGDVVNTVVFSQNGDPREADAFSETIPGKGGYLDAPTKEAIISCGFLKNRLIVQFERSTYELAYTGNEVLPFRWQEINSELGCESTFSTVEFDKVLISVGNVGITACNGSNVERIDQKIPQEVFRIHNGNEGPFRVAGIRDYFTEMVYFTFPSQDDNPTYPNRVLVYNYATNSWAFNDDSITAFGYFQRQTGLTWAEMTSPWGSYAIPWNSGSLQAQTRMIVAGNQQGYTFILEPDMARNAPALQITNIVLVDGIAQLTIVNHNLTAGQYILIENVTSSGNLDEFNDRIYEVEFVDGDEVSVLYPEDDGVPLELVGNYEGLGTVTRVSRIDILTKQYNFYNQSGDNLTIPRVDFLVDKTENGEITVDYFTSTASLGMLSEGSQSGSLVDNGILVTTPEPLVPLEAFQKQFWHSIYLHAEGETIQLRIFLSRDQMTKRILVSEDPTYAYPALQAFELNAMVFYSKPLHRP